LVCRRFQAKLLQVLQEKEFGAEARPAKKNDSPIKLAKVL